MSKIKKSSFQANISDITSFYVIGLDPIGNVISVEAQRNIVTTDINNVVVNIQTGKSIFLTQAEFPTQLQTGINRCEQAVDLKDV